jgi:pumilio family protein 6
LALVAKFVLNILKLIFDVCFLRPSIRHSLTHRLLNEYTTICNADQRDELFEAVRDRCLELVHTKDGVRVAMQILWASTAKQRKLIVRAMKGLAVKSAIDECGSLFLMALFATLDDTILLNKCITQVRMTTYVLIDLFSFIRT